MELISNIPSSSSSSNTSKFKHDVFISFRGEDTRNNFTSHLHKALLDKQIQTYIDVELSRGDEISPSLLKAIEESKVSVIIFSKDYASSRWCLQELVQILECKKSYGQIVIPVFYNVNPSDVRHQTGTYGNAFTNHEERFKKSLGKVQRWKDALKEAADLPGWDSSTIKDESVLIEIIVVDILKRLKYMSSCDIKGLVGIDTEIEKIVSLLGREDVRCVGIWGIGGIGKTTLAKAVFNKIKSQFEGFYFIPNIREESEKSGGLNHLQGELLSTIVGDRNLNRGTAIAMNTFTRNRLGHKKLLIVFDDVTDFQQIETLIGGFDHLNSQSRIIITTRDRQVLRNCGVDQEYEYRIGWKYPQEILNFSQMEYLKPMNFYKEIFKDILIKRDYLKPGRLLGLDVSDKYVSLAVSDWKNLTAVPLRALDRQEISMSLMADMIQSLISEHNLVGFVVTSKYARPMDEQTKIFIDDLCKTRNFEGLKYTLWDCGTTSKNAEFVFKQHLKFIIEELLQPLSKTIMDMLQPQPQPQPLSKTIMDMLQPQPQPQDMSKTIMEKCQPQAQAQAQAQDMSKTIMEKCYAVSTLQGYLDATNKMVKEDWD